MGICILQNKCLNSKVSHSLRRTICSRIGTFLAFRELLCCCRIYVIMLMLFSTRRACLGIFFVGRTSGQTHEFQECSSSSRTSSSGTDCLRDRMKICMYLYSCIGPPLGAIKWCSLSVIAPLKSLDIDNRNNQYRQYWESTGTIHRGNTTNVFQTAQHSAARHKTTIPTPNIITTRMAGGNRWLDGCQPCTLCSDRDLCSDTPVTRLPSLSRFDVLLHYDFVFLYNMFPTVVAYLQYCTYGNAPPQASGAKADIYFERWRWICLECKPGCAALMSCFARSKHRRWQIARKREARTVNFT